MVTPTWPSNQWPSELLWRSVGETARQEQQAWEEYGDQPDLPSLRSMVMKQWLEAMFPAGNA